MQYKFPKDFLWGFSSSSYQIEGAVSKDGRGISIWDTFSHTKGKVLNDDTGDIACDHYHRYKEDILLMKELGVQVYHFSTAWTRILPEGKGKINQKGLDFYDRLVDYVLEQDMQPWLTLYHWDLPQALQDEGGWVNRDTVEYFAEYADIMYKALGDRIPFWFTHNEPWVASYLGYGMGLHAPGIKNWKKAVQATHHILLSHGKAVEIFRSYNYPTNIGLNPNFSAVHPASEAQEDIDASKRYFEYHNTWFLDALFKGSYPSNLWSYYEKHNIAPQIEDKDFYYISQPMDFMGVNFYSRNVIKYHKDEWLDAQVLSINDVEKTAMGWEIYPAGLYELLVYIHKNYPPIDLYISENGASFKDVVEEDNTIHDTKRINFLHAHFESAWKAIQDSVPLKGYLVWSVLDNFEWAYGYTERFGLVYVDYSTQKRILKNSALFFKQTIMNNGI